MGGTGLGEFPASLVELLNRRRGRRFSKLRNPPDLVRMAFPRDAKEARDVSRLTFRKIILYLKENP